MDSKKFKNIEQEAKNEIQKEKEDEIKKRMKKKLREIDDAQAILRGLKREFDDLNIELNI